ncbi:hypothetical protein E2562_019520 [Oryza meyeriana var. granulata]|uniref:Uncharacterized protein n=1 Tax=Oryza meyeriana var. granulata TaxID=110450 RepID=A0A6G1CH74_9ORYZ|nr:hypothetical protein E2562_019520 [Oryza meyeriana var. granulata]
MIIATGLLDAGLLRDKELLHLFDLAMQSESNLKTMAEKNATEEACRMRQQAQMEFGHARSLCLHAVCM